MDLILGYPDGKTAFYRLIYDGESISGRGTGTRSLQNVRKVFIGRDSCAMPGFTRETPERGVLEKNGFLQREWKPTAADIPS